MAGTAENFAGIRHPLNVRRNLNRSQTKHMFVQILIISNCVLLFKGKLLQKYDSINEIILKISLSFNMCMYYMVNFQNEGHFAFLKFFFNQLIN